MPTPVLERIVRTALPRCRLLAIQPLAGLRNANFKLLLDRVPRSVVLRIYEQDASLCRKELDLLRLVRGAVPVPEVIHAEPNGFEDLPPLAVLRFVQGIPFAELVRAGDRAGIAQAARSAGEILAAIGRVTFPKSGWLGAGPAVTAPLLEGPDPIPRFVDLCLASARLPGQLCDRTHSLVWSQAPRLARLAAETCLVHGDFNGPNLLVRRTARRWSVAAVLDWEFAVSGSPLADIGNFLRYEIASHPLLEPQFSSGYKQVGPGLPRNWRRLARLVDLAALCEALTRPRLPDSAAAELVELLSATVDNRDPALSR